MNVSGCQSPDPGELGGNTSGDAIYLAELTAAEIKDNEVGELGPVGGSGILIPSAPGNSTGNAIGSNDPSLANVFGDIGDDAIKIVGDGNDGNQILANIGGPADALFIDLEGAPGPGNGLQRPEPGRRGTEGEADHRQGHQRDRRCPTARCGSTAPAPPRATSRRSSRS